MTMNDISDIACNDQGFDVAVDLGPDSCHDVID